MKTIINTKNNKRNALYVQLRSPNVHNINESLNNEGVVQEGYSEDEVPLEEEVVKEAAAAAVAVGAESVA